MDNIVGKVFNSEHTIIIPLEHPDPDFPNRISGIGCAYCDTIYQYDAHLMIDHLQHKHNLKIKEIIPSIR